MDPNAEAIHDAEIMPALAALRDRCAELGMSFAAYVEWAPGKYSSTTGAGDATCWPLRMAAAWLRSRNVDSFIMSAMHYAREYGHSSVCLLQLGVPEKPAAAAAIERGEGEGRG